MCVYYIQLDRLSSVAMEMHHVVVCNPRALRRRCTGSLL